MKPFTRGNALNVPIAFSDPMRRGWIMRMKNIPEAVYERGCALSLSRDYPTIEDLTLAKVDCGSYATCMAAGAIKFSGKVTGHITCDLCDYDEGKKAL
jgi:hypothetical protein